MITRKYVSFNKRVQILVNGNSVHDPMRVVIEGIDPEGYFEPGNRHEFECDFDDIERYYAPLDEFDRVA